MQVVSLGELGRGLGLLRHNLGGRFHAGNVREHTEEVIFRFDLLERVCLQDLNTGNVMPLNLNRLV